MLANHLHTLESADLIRLARAQPELEYYFRHTLIQEAAYNSILKADRQKMHTAIGRTLERMYPERVAEIAPLLAEHFDRAGDGPRALRYYRLAGEQAMRQYATPEAIQHFSRALGLLEDDPLAEVHIRRARGLAFETLGDFESASRDYQGALGAAQAAGKPAEEWQALLDLGKLWAARDYTQSGKFLQRALDQAQRLNDPPALGHSLNRMGNWHLNVDQPADALQYHRQALALFEQAGHPAGIAETLDLLGMASFLSGEQVQGRQYYLKAVELFRQMDERRGLASSLATMGLCCAAYQADTLFALGDTLPQALRQAEQSLEIARGMHWRAGEAYALVALTFNLGAQGEYGRALQCANQSLQIAEEIHHRQWWVASRCARGLVYLDVLAFEKAQEELEQALAQARELGSLHWMRTVSGNLASVYLAQRQPERAEAVLNALPPPSAGRPSIGQRRCTCARVELALEQGDAQLALQLVEQLLALDNVPAGQEPRRLPLRLAYLKGQALLALGRLVEAEAMLKLTQAVAVEQNAQSWLWRLYFLLGRVYQQQGQAGLAAGQAAVAQVLAARLAQNLPETALQENFLRQAYTLIGFPEAQTGRPPR